MPDIGCIIMGVSTLVALYNKIVAIEQAVAEYDARLSTLYIRRMNSDVGLAVMSYDVDIPFERNQQLGVICPVDTSMFVTAASYIRSSRVPMHHTRIARDGSSGRLHDR